MLPFSGSRRLTGANLFFGGCGAVLEAAAGHAATGPDAALIAGWRARIARARAHLDWRESAAVARTHATGTSLALAAPVDGLYTATEVNEWALCATLYAGDPARWATLEADMLAEALENAADPASVVPAVLEEGAALARLARLASLEARPALRALIAAAQARRLPHTLDDEVLTLGAGTGHRDFPLAALPARGAVPWEALRGVPTALVTGSNGKTTSVRLIAACARAHAWPAAFCCTDGVFFDGEALVAGDYSGPAGARAVLREPRALAAIIETARGGILRRGIAVSHAGVALVTNVSADHFGEYGIDDLGALADVKLSVAGVLEGDGLLVLNADDPQLCARAAGLAARFGREIRLGWFALDADLPRLAAHRASGGATCGVRAGHLVLEVAGGSHDLGALAGLPLTVGGSAAYNVANLAGAALAAHALGVPSPAIAAVYAHFGARIADNPGRLMRFERDGVRILVDYAHNPEGMRGLLEVAEHVRGGEGRLGVLVGQAGNRTDAEVTALARAVAAFRPARVVIKENEAYLRGRAVGEIPRLIHATLRSEGLAEEALTFSPTELDGVRCALEWARPGDVLALTVHAPQSRAAVMALLG